jgi:two-component system, NtrC family, C4-dicarboxylate transport sensor histidine kinase DctB
MTKRPSRPHLLHPVAPWLALALLLVPLAAILTARWAEHTALGELAATGETRAQIYRAHLIHEMDRPADLLLALSRDPLAEDILADPDHAAPRVAHLNALLADLAPTAALTDLYLMDKRGRTLAASNAAGPVSFIDHNFAFRDYFTAAMAGHTGRQFALGTTSNVLGYYVAQPVRAGGRIVGAMVAKVALARLEALAAGVPERLLVTDSQGRVLLTDIEGLRFQPLPAPDRDGHVLLPENGRLVPALIDTLPLPWQGWRMSILQPLVLAEGHAAAAAAAGGVAALLLVLALWSIALRRQNQRALQSLEQSTRATLEAELRARTAELVQAAKLATIGQMAAGLVHEINQPLAALQAFAGNATRFLDLGREDKVRANLDEIAALVGRLAGLTRRLKGFSRRPADTLEPVPLAPAIERVLAVLGPKLREFGVETTLDTGSPGMAVRAEQIRLDQVLINLADNAIDAMKRSEDENRVLALRVGEEDGMVTITVADNGPGITPETMARLFDPFFSTKPAGEGLGLGLSVASAIVRDFGGTLSARNRHAGGAIFTLSLPRAEGKR